MDVDISVSNWHLVDKTQLMHLMDRWSVKPMGATKCQGQTFWYTLFFFRKFSSNIFAVLSNPHRKIGGHYWKFHITKRTKLSVLKRTQKFQIQFQWYTQNEKQAAHVLTLSYPVLDAISFIIIARLLLFLAILHALLHIHCLHSNQCCCYNFKFKFCCIANINLVTEQK